MAHDVAFARARQGLTAREAPDHRHVDFGPDTDPLPLRPTDGRRAAWGRILGRASRDLGHVEAVEYLHSSTVETVGPPGRVQLDYVPGHGRHRDRLRHWGPTALRVREPAYRIARTVEEEGGPTGHDFEVEQPTRARDPARAAARPSSVSAWAQHHLS